MARRLGKGEWGRRARAARGRGGSPERPGAGERNDGAAGRTPVPRPPGSSSSGNPASAERVGLGRQELGAASEGMATAGAVRVRARPRRGGDEKAVRSAAAQGWRSLASPARGPDPAPPGGAG